MSQESLKEKTAKGLFWGAMNSSLMQILNAVFGMILLWILDPEDYGMVGVLGIYSAIAQNIQESGFISALINRKNATQRDFSSVFWFNIVVGICIYVILWMCAPLIADYNHDDRLIWLSRYTFLGFFCASFSIVPRAKLMKEMKAKELTYVTIAALLTSDILGIVMALCGMKYWGIASQAIIYVSMVSILSWAYSHWRPSFQFSIQPIKEMFGFSCKILITNIFENVNKYAFETFLAGSFSKRQIGFYTNANKWNLMGSQTVTGMVQDIAQPMFVQVGDEPERLRRAFSKMLRFTSFVAFPAMFGFALIAPEIVRGIMGDKWANSIPLLRLLCIGGAFLPISRLYSKYIISRGKSGIYMWNTIIISLLVIVDLLCVSRFHWSFLGFESIELMILIYVSINILWLLVWHWFVWRDIRLGFFKSFIDILPFLLLSVATMLATHVITLAITNVYILLIAKIIIAAAIYIGVLWFMKSDMLRESVDFLRKK